MEQMSSDELVRLAVRAGIETVTFQVPAAQIGPATDERLKEKASALRKAFDFESCDCESLERGSTHAGARIVTLGEFKLEVPPSATLGEFKLKCAAAERYV